MYIIPDAFKQFISLSCDRALFIQEYLANKNIKSYILPIEGKNHIYVSFPQEQYNNKYKIKTVIAHYDRYETSPGANDNSAAVFCMMEWAQNLIKSKTFHNIRLIFTDGEECGKQGVNEQGAFQIAALFKKLNLKNDDVFVFDCMGRGNIPVIAEMNFSESVSKKFVNNYSDLLSRTQKIIKKASGEKWFMLPFNYSDNASFIANGIPAVQITLLPSDEISLALKGEVPKTWQLLHTLNDNLNSLNPDSFELTMKILNVIENSKFLI